MSEHDVTVDRGKIEQELLLAGEPDPRGQAGGKGQGGPGPEAPPRPWKEVAQVAAWGAQRGAPNWNIPDNEREDLAAALEAVLDKHFPGGMQFIEQWGPWSRLLFVSGSIVVARGIDWNTMTLRPLHEPPPDEGDIGEPEGRPSDSPGEPEGSPQGQPSGAPQGKPQGAAPRKKRGKKRAKKKAASKKKGPSQVRSATIG